MHEVNNNYSGIVNLTIKDIILLYYNGGIVAKSQKSARCKPFDMI